MSNKTRRTNELNLEMEQKCLDFFYGLGVMLDKAYETKGSCNMDMSQYLCPKGTTNQVTYNSKPEKSFRISDHWNWYSNMRKCPDKEYIQCYTDDLPAPKERCSDKGASIPIIGRCIALFENGAYHVVYGEKYDKETRRWSWIEDSLENVLAKVM